MFNYYIKNLNKYNENILYLIVILLITGPALPDIVATILSIISISIIIRDKKINENTYILLLPFIFLIIPNIFSSYFPNPLLEQLLNLRYVFFALFIIIYYSLNLDNLIKFLLILTIIISLDLIFQYIFKYNIIGLEINSGHKQSRASSFFRDELIAGSYILKLSLPVLGYYIYNKRFIIVILLLVLYQLSIISSGERMSFLLFNFGCLILMIFHISKKNYKFFISGIIISLLVFSTTYVVFDGVKHRINNALNSLNISDDGSINSQHLGHYIVAYEIYKDNKIFGTGHKTFRVECKEKENLVKVNSEIIKNNPNVNRGCSIHPHNTYMELLSDSGLTGFISFFVLIVLIIFKSIKNKIYISPASGFLASFIIIVWPLSTAGNFFNNRVAILNFLIIGILLYFCKKDLFNKKTIKYLKI